MKILVVLFLISSSTFAQNVLWTKIYNRGADEFGNAIVADGTNFIIVGTYNVTNSEWLCLKYSSAGDTIWTRRYTTGSSYDDEATGVAVDSDHNVIIVGYSQREDSIYLVLRKLNSSGTLTWTKTLRRGYQTIGEGVTTDNSDNIYVVGSIYDGNDSDILLIKYNSSGDTIWTRTFSSPDDDYGEAIALDGNNNIIVTGGIGSFGTSDVVTIKYSTQGNILWTIYYDSGQDDIGNAVKVDTSNNIIVAGATGAIDSHKYLLIKYASNGTQSWVRQFNSSLNDIAYGCVIDPAPFDKGNGNQSLDYVRDNNQPDKRCGVDNYNNIIITGTSGNYANYDYLTVKYASTGDTLWSRRYDRNIDDDAMGIAIDASSNLAVTGFSFSGSDYDIVTIKYSNTSGIQEENEVHTLSNSFTVKSPYLIRRNLNFNLSVTRPDWYDINLFDVTGKKVLPVYSGNLQTGEYNYNNTIPNSGVYFLVIKPLHILNFDSGQTICKKIVSIK